MTTSVYAEKSTTDRNGSQATAATSARRSARSRDPKKLLPGWVRGGVSLMGRVAPSVTAVAVTPFFFRTQRSKRPEREQALFARATRRHVEHDGERLAVFTWGEGPTVVLSHGWNGRAGQLAPFVEPLLAAGRRVVAFDYAGHGASTGRGTSLPQMAEALRAVIDAVGEVEAVVAHSLGAAATILAIVDGLAVERVALVAPPSSPRPWLARFGDVFGLDERALDQTRARIERITHRRLEELEVLPHAERLTVPALIVHDRNDAEVPFASGALIHRAWSGSTLIETEGLGHTRILRDAEIVRAVTQFITRTA